MNTVIEQILTLSGDVPNKTRYRRALERLTQRELFDKLQTLRTEKRYTVERDDYMELAAIRAREVQPTH